MGENTELVRAALAAFARGEVDRALEYAHPEIVSERVPPIPDPQTYHGVAGVLQMYADWTADFDEFEMDPVAFEEAGDRVIVEMLQRGTGKASGVPVVGRFWLVYTVAGNRITRQDAYLTREQALASPLP
jgi:ketosteroid isomerase-like protein